MTVFTMPVRPGREAGALPGPVPWRQMIWVTWRQHRGLLLGILAVFIVAVVAMLVVGARIHHDYGALASCHLAASAACAQASHYFNSTDWHEGNAIHVAVQAAPVLLAMFAGPPVVARELENGTFRYAWTQGVGRVRWTAAKLTLLGTVIVTAALVIGQESAWLFAPFLKARNMTDLSPAVFGTRGIVYPAWALIALCTGAFLGELLRRTLPAMAATLAAYVGLAALTWFYLRGRYPVATLWPMQLFEAGWLSILAAVLAAGTIWLVYRHAS